MLATALTPRRLKRNRHRWRKSASGRRDYNYQRDYESGTGRYVESDPVGLEGGISTFGYVEQAPLRFIDPLGLSARACSGNNGKTVCDGNGGFETINCNTTCTKSCTQAHEDVHKSDLEREHPNACKGRPKGSDPALTVRRIQDAYNFKKETECRAHEAGKRCAEKLSCCKEAESYIQEQDRHLRAYKCNIVDIYWN